MFFDFFEKDILININIYVVVYSMVGHSVTTPTFCTLFLVRKPQIQIIFDPPFPNHVQGTRILEMLAMQRVGVCTGHSQERLTSLGISLPRITVSCIGNDECTKGRYRELAMATGAVPANLKQFPFVAWCNCSPKLPTVCLPVLSSSLSSSLFFRLVPHLVFHVSPTWCGMLCPPCCRGGVIFAILFEHDFFRSGAWRFETIWPQSHQIWRVGQSIVHVFVWNSTFKTITLHSS